MAIDWRTAFEAALREHDPAKVGNACDRARTLINDRNFELLREHPLTSAVEREELDEALRQLVIHEHIITRPPSSRS
jgi:hypothetical protein